MTELPIEIVISDDIQKELEGLLGNAFDYGGQVNNKIIDKLINWTDINSYSMRQTREKIKNSLTKKVEWLSKRYDWLWTMYPTVIKDLSKQMITHPWEVGLRAYFQNEKLGLFDYVNLYRRGVITVSEFMDTLRYLGIDSHTVYNAQKISEYYPSTSDLVSFAVREAFEPDESLFIHGKNAIPEPFSRYGEKVGLKKEWIKRFWHSHWRLLGAEQILEGFHRGFLTRDNLLEYLRRLDYTENDRELILSMSYNLLTRVDVRRVFEQGLISSKELFDYYGTLGFSEKDKVLMTSLSKQLRFIEMKDLRKLYIDEFEAGLLTETEVKNNLRGTGLDNDEINLFLDYSDKINDLQFKIELKNQITQRFYEGLIDFDELVEQLRGLGVSNRELKRIEKNAVLFDFRKPKLPTIAELKRYLKKDIIDLTKFVYYALKIGYSSEHIFFMLSDLDYKL